METTKPTVSIKNAMQPNSLEIVKENYSKSEYFKQVGINLLGEHYKFTPYKHSEIIILLEKIRKAQSIEKFKLSNLAGYTATCYHNLLKGKRFSQKSFERFLKAVKLDPNEYLHPAYRENYDANLFTPKPIEKPSYGVLTLEAAIKMVKDAGYKVSKRVETWEEI